MKMCIRDSLLEDFNDKVIKRKHIELADTMLISINKKAIDNIYNEGSQLYHSVNAVSYTHLELAEKEVGENIR